MNRSPRWTSGGGRFLIPSLYLPCTFPVPSLYGGGRFLAHRYGFELSEDELEGMRGWEENFHTFWDPLHANR